MVRRGARGDGREGTAAAARRRGLRAHRRRDPLTERAVYLRLGASLLAVAAGAAGLVVAIELLRSVPGPPGAVAGEATAPPAIRVAAIPGGRIPTPDDPAFPSPPPGAVVLGREAGSRALGLAIVPTGPRSLVRVSVLTPGGRGAAGLDVAVRFGAGAPVTLGPCGPGCYQAKVAGADVARRASVRLGRASYGFELPGGGLPPDGAGIVRRASAVWRALKTLVWHERLAGSPTAVIHTVYRAVAPDELSYTIRGASAAVIIGRTRWDRSGPVEAWVRSTQDPPLRQPLPFWAGALDVRVLGSGRLRGHAVWHVSFFDPTTLAWFEVKIDKATGRTLELWMTTTSHFMHHVYGPFDTPFRLRPPAAGQ